MKKKLTKGSLVSGAILCTATATLIQSANADVTVNVSDLSGKTNPVQATVNSSFSVSGSTAEDLLKAWATAKGIETKGLQVYQVTGSSEASYSLTAVNNTDTITDGARYIIAATSLAQSTMSDKEQSGQTTGGSTTAPKAYTTEYSNQLFTRITGTDSNNPGSAIRNAVNTYYDITGSVFENNSATSGNLYFNGTDSNNQITTSNVRRVSTVSNSIFNNNTSGNSGGAIDSSNIANVSGSYFSGNIANGTGSEGNGGAIQYSHRGQGNITNSTFVGNTANNYGGAIYHIGGGVSNNTVGGVDDRANSPIIISGNTFTNNTASASGGALAFYPNRGSGSEDQINSNAQISGNVFDGNTASTGGGAVYINTTGLGDRASSLTYTFTDTTFINNKATNADGNVLYVDGNDSKKTTVNISGGSIDTAQSIHSGSVTPSDFYLGSNVDLSLSGINSASTATDKTITLKEGIYSTSTNAGANTLTLNDQKVIIENTFSGATSLVTNLNSGSELQLKKNGSAYSLNATSAILNLQTENDGTPDAFINGLTLNNGSSTATFDSNSSVKLDLNPRKMTSTVTETSTATDRSLDYIVGTSSGTINISDLHVLPSTSEEIWMAAGVKELYSNPFVVNSTTGAASGSSTISVASGTTVEDSKYIYEVGTDSSNVAIKLTKDDVKQGLPRAIADGDTEYNIYDTWSGDEEVDIWAEYGTDASKRPDGATAGAENNGLIYKDITVTGGSANPTDHSADVSIVAKGNPNGMQINDSGVNATFKDIGTISGFQTDNSLNTDGALFDVDAGTLNLTDIGSITGNTASGNGGAINLAKDATVNVNADNKNTTITSNTASGQGQDIYNCGTLNLNAQGGDITVGDIAGCADNSGENGQITVKSGTDKKVTVTSTSDNDIVIDENSTLVSISDTDSNIDVTGHNVTVGTGGKLGDGNGKLTIGTEGSNSTVIDLINGSTDSTTADTVNFENIDVNGPATAKLETGLSNKDGEWIDKLGNDTTTWSKTTDGLIDVSGVKVVEDMDQGQFVSYQDPTQSVSGADEVIGLSGSGDHYVDGDKYTYKLTQLDTAEGSGKDGDLKFEKTYSIYGLPLAITNGDDTYTIPTEGEDVEVWARNIEDRRDDYGDANNGIFYKSMTITGNGTTGDTNTIQGHNNASGNPVNGMTLNTQDDGTTGVNVTLENIDNVTGFTTAFTVGEKAILTLNNTDVTDNGTTDIVNAGTTNVTGSNVGAIDNTGTLNLNDGTTVTSVTGTGDNSGKGKLTVLGSVTVGNTAKNDLTIAKGDSSSGILTVSENGLLDLDGQTFTIEQNGKVSESTNAILKLNNSTVNTNNGVIDSVSLGDINVTGTDVFNFDVDLANETTDSYASATGFDDFDATISLGNSDGSSHITLLSDMQEGTSTVYVQPFVGLSIDKAQNFTSAYTEDDKLKGYSANFAYTVDVSEKNNDGEAWLLFTKYYTTDKNGLPYAIANSHAEYTLQGDEKVEVWSKNPDGTLNNGVFQADMDIKGDGTASIIGLNNEGINGMTINNADHDVTVTDINQITDFKSTKDADDPSVIHNQNGGAFDVEDGTLTFNNVKEVTGNHADGNGGGLNIAENGTVTINAGTDGTKITGNTAGGQGGDIYNCGTLKLNSADGAITIGDMAGCGTSGTVEVTGDKGTTITGMVTGNDVTVDDTGVLKAGDEGTIDITGQTATVDKGGKLGDGKGTLTIGTNDNGKTTIDIQNGNPDEVSFDKVVIDGDSTLNLDAGLNKDGDDGEWIDKVIAKEWQTDNNGKVDVSGVKVVEDMGVGQLVSVLDPTPNITGADEVITLNSDKPLDKLGPNYLYELTQNDEGSLVFTKTASNVGLPYAVANQKDGYTVNGKELDDGRDFELQGDELIDVWGVNPDGTKNNGIVTKDIKVDANGEFAIKGVNGKDVNGNTVTVNGMTISSGVNADFTEIKEISGFTAGTNSVTQGNGGAFNVQNGGTLNLTDTVITGNTADKLGGAIYNEGTVNFAATNTDVEIAGNKDSTGANAVYNAGTFNLTAGDGKTISVQDAISGSGNTNANLNLNGAGNYKLSGKNTGNAVNVSNGTVTPTSNEVFDSSDSLSLTGGSLVLGDENDVRNIRVGSFDVAENASVNVSILGKDKYSSITADTFKNLRGALNLYVAPEVVSKNENATYTIFADAQGNQDAVADNMNFLFHNERYKLKQVGNGTYVIDSGSVIPGEEIACKNGCGNHENAASIAKAWTDSGSAGLNQDVFSGLDALSQSDGAKYVDELYAVAPSVAPIVKMHALQNTFALTSLAEDRTKGSTYSRGNIFSVEENSDHGTAFWMNVGVDDVRYMTGCNYSRATADVYRISAGLDQKFTENFLAGVGYSYGNHGINAYRKIIDADSNSVMLYGVYNMGNWFVDGMAAYTASEFDESKNVLGKTYNADYKANTVSGKLSTGYNIQVTDRLTVTPEVAVVQTNVKRKGYTDTLNQKVSSQSMQNTQAKAGATVAYGSHDMDLRLGVFYGNDVKSDREKMDVLLGNGASYSVKANKLNRNAAEVKAGVSYHPTKNVKFGIGFKGEYRPNYSDNSARLELEINF